MATGPDGTRGGNAVDRLTMTRGQRAAAALVGLMVLALGAAGMLTSRLNGDAPGSLPPIAIIVAALGIVLLALALRGRTFGWIPARAPALLPQLVLTIGLVTLVAVGSGVAQVRTGVVGRSAGWGSMVLAVAIAVIAVLRGWVPGIGGPRRPGPRG